MKAQYLGDSYDHVKRTLLEGDESPWLAAMMLDADLSEAGMDSYEILLKTTSWRERPRAPLRDERAEYFRLLREECNRSNSNVFLDPCTGIRPTRRFRQSMTEHVSIEELMILLRGSDRLLLCFDQSLSRGSEDEDRQEKLAEIQACGAHAFYFSSHASFLGASMNPTRLTAWIDRLRKLGLPDSRLQRVHDINEA